MIHNSPAAPVEPAPPAADPAASGRDRRRAETTARILDAAERIAGEDGVEALTMARLGDEIGYRAGALYRYFASKEALLAALLVRVVREAGAMVTAASTDAQGLAERARRPMTAEARLLLPMVFVARGYLALAEQRPAQMALLVRALAAPRPLVDDASVAPLASEALALFRDASGMFRAAREAEALAPGDDLQRVSLLWAALHGVVGNRKLARFEIAGLSPAVLVNELVRALLVGWGARREDVDDCIDRAARAAAREG
jgi:AcrR family transcriptional regulator